MQVFRCLLWSSLQLHVTMPGVSNCVHVLEANNILNLVFFDAGFRVPSVAYSLHLQVTMPGVSNCVHILEANNY